MRLLRLQKYLPCVAWIRTYNREVFTSDLVAAVIVTIMLIPQSLAYALLAGLPAEVGLYASILPLMVYALFGTSRTLSVGPVAVVSLMTASAIDAALAAGAVDPVAVAMLLALVSGVFLALLGILRFGFLAHFLSHPVVSGFITASSLIIALSQLKHLLGVSSSGDNIPELALTLAMDIANINLPTLSLGAGALLFLLISRKWLKPLLTKLGMGAFGSDLLVKAMPVVAVVVTTLLAWHLDLQARGVAVVGTVPSGLPPLRLPALEVGLLGNLLLPAILISIIGYVESVSVGKTLASKRREKIDPDQELIGLGAANVAAAFSGGLPVSGGFSRSVVNFDAGARTPGASLLTAGGIAVVTLLFTPYLAWLPNATLAATIIVAVLSLADFSILRRTWKYSVTDFIAVTATMVVTLLLGVEIGVSCGVAASLLLHLYKTSRPHIAEVGEIANTGHYRNIKRHEVRTHPAILSLRVDESLYFPNAAFIEEEIIRSLRNRPGLRHVVLMCTAVNEIDISALEVLESINTSLQMLGIGFHLSEIKGPVMDALARSNFLSHLNGQVFMSQQQAVRDLLELERTMAGTDPDFRDYQI